MSDFEKWHQEEFGPCDKENSTTLGFKYRRKEGWDARKLEVDGLLRQLAEANNFIGVVCYAIESRGDTLRGDLTCQTHTNLDI